MSRTVLIIQHAEPEPPGLIASVLAERGYTCRIIQTHRHEPLPATLGDAVGLVVMGGPMGVYDQAEFPHLAGELHLLQAAVAAQLPVLGVCLGSQLLAAALGARVYPGPVKELGWYPVQLSAAGAHDPLWQGEAAAFTALVWHGDVFDLPTGATLLASTTQVAHHAFRFGPKAYGLLFHLEATPAQLAGMCSAFAGELASAGVSGAHLQAAGAAHWPALLPLGRRVVGRWAALLPPPH